MSSVIVYPEKLSEIRELAKKAITENIDYIVNAATDAADAQEVTCHRVPYIVFCGHGRCGKDTATTFFKANYPAAGNAKNVSQAVLPFMVAALKAPVDQLIAERHQHREFWFNFCNALREDNPALLVELTTADCFVYGGIRAAIELEAARKAGLADLVVWIEREVLPDPTLEYSKDDCDVIIENNGSLSDFYRRLRKLGDLLLPSF
jgi:hypothetical protein